MPDLLRECAAIGLEPRFGLAFQMAAPASARRRRCSFAGRIAGRKADSLHF
jgi:hypothetical protein